MRKRASVAAPVPSGPGVEDGRHERGRASRERVVIAFHELINEGVMEPSVDAVSERAQVSRRLVFNHFASLDNLFAAVLERQIETIRTVYVAVDAALPFPDRLREFVRTRSALNERVTPMRRASLLRVHSSTLLTDALSNMRVFMRHDVLRVFATELAQAPSPQRAAQKNALSACAEWSYWRALRDEQGLDEEGARQALTLAIHALLSAARETALGAR